MSAQDFQRTIFTPKDGALDRTWAIAQTDDGWLWFGGPPGLTRFDGVSFEKINVASEDGRFSEGVAKLYAIPHGGLLIGHLSGGVSILHHGTVRRFEEVLPAGRPIDFVSDREGHIWGTFERRVMRFDGKGWLPVGKDWNLPTGAPTEVFIGSGGTLWLHTFNEISRLKVGSKVFESVAKVDVPGALIQGQHGTMYFLAFEGDKKMPLQWSAEERDFSEASRKASNAYIDRAGNYWTPAEPFRLPIPTVRGLEKFGTISAFFQDVDNNMWLAENGQLNRLKPSNITRVTESEKIAPGVSRLSWINVTADAQGRVWFTDYPSPIAADKVISKAALWTVGNDGRPTEVEEVGVPLQAVSDSAGLIWVFTDKGLWEQSGKTLVKRTEYPGTFSMRDAGLSAGCAGGVWAAISGDALRRFDGKAWQDMTSIPSLPPTTPTSQKCDRDGNLWLGYSDGAIARQDQTLKPTLFRFKGPGIGTISSISIGRHTIVGGAQGLAVLRNNEFVRVSSGQAVLNGITGIVEAPDGYIWLTSSQGLLRLWESDLEAIAKSPGTSIRTELFDADDGFPGTTYSLAQQINPIAIDKDHKVWFAGLGGLALIDAARVPPAAQTAQLVFKTLNVGGRLIEANGELSLPAGTRNIEISYTALRARHPARLRFRYRLGGVDDNWVAVADRRQANYANLAPGTYHFQVEVADEFGAWTGRSSTLNFAIPPTFIQSRAFQLLCVAMAIALLTLAFRLRVRQHEKRVERNLLERLNERERIARELHDTLLQGTQAFILKVHAANKLTRQDEPVHHALDKALDQATTVMVEARNRIEDLRVSPKAEDDLASNLKRFGEELTQGGMIDYRVVIEGLEQDIAPDVLREAGLIAREALLNAFNHARPSFIELRIVFSDDLFQLSVRDDGIGIDEKALARPVGGRHWGLPGMQERASSIAGTLNIWSRRGLGTEVELSVPATSAYQHVATPSRWHSVRKAFGFER